MPPKTKAGVKPFIFSDFIVACEEVLASRFEPRFSKNKHMAAVNTTAMHFLQDIKEDCALVVNHYNRRPRTKFATLELSEKVARLFYRLATRIEIAYYDDMGDNSAIELVIKMAGDHLYFKMCCLIRQVSALRKWFSKREDFYQVINRVDGDIAIDSDDEIL